MPPRSACTCPSSEVPAPNGTMGSRKRWLMRGDFRDLDGRGGEADDIGRGRGVVRLAVAVMFADGVGVRSARAEERAQLRERAGNGGRVCMSSV